MHRVDGELLRRAVRVAVVGCGGTGSAIAAGLPYLHQAMVALGHPGGLDVTLIDGDVVSEANCVRQPFSRGEIGFPKAVVLATRVNMFWGLRWAAAPHHITATDTTDADILIGCVDSAAARKVIDRVVGSLTSRTRYWLDLGNAAEEGQFVLGQPENGTNRDRPERLLTSAEIWPADVLTARGPDLPSCSAAEAITRQAPFINPLLAQHALALLGRLFRREITHHGAFVNLATGVAQPIGIRPVKLLEAYLGRPVGTIAYVSHYRRLKLVADGVGAIPTAAEVEASLRAAAPAKPVA